MTILPLETWENIFRNSQESNEEIEIVWLFATEEWCICVDLEFFEFRLK